MHEHKKQSALEQLKHSAKITANCKNHAANRLEKLHRFYYGVTVFVSLGLIFIPLMIFLPTKVPYLPKNNMSNEFLNIVQIFLAVAVLVLSVIESNSSYELKVYQLRRTGSKLRSFNKKLKLIMELEKNTLESKGESNEVIICKSEKQYNRILNLQKEYDEILESSIDHSDDDYIDVLHEKDNCFNKLEKNFYCRKIFRLTWLYALVFIFLALFELSIILNMLGIISWYDSF